MNDQKMIAYLRNLHNQQMDEFLDTLQIFNTETHHFYSEDIVAQKLKQQLIDDFIKIPIELKTCRFLVWCLSKKFFLIDYIDDSLFTTELKKKILIIRPKTFFYLEKFCIEPELYKIYKYNAKVDENKCKFFLVGLVSFVFFSYFLLKYFILLKLDGGLNDEEIFATWLAIGISFVSLVVGILGYFFYYRKKQKEIWKGL